MPQNERTTLWGALASASDLCRRCLWAREGAIELAALVRGSSLGDRLDMLCGRAVLLAISDQLAAALALIELDGVARRIVLCPPAVPSEHLTSIIAGAEIDAVIGDRSDDNAAFRSISSFVDYSPSIVASAGERTASVETEWVLLTSGTTGPPKLAVHTFRSLVAPIGHAPMRGRGAVWSTFYDIRRYGGLQIFLRAMLGGGSIVLSDQRERVADFVVRAGAHGVTHISGTPSHWRRVLMSSAAREMAPGYVRLSGEIIDQALLDQLRATYPTADIGHAFASTEAGVAFEVEDGLAGFPARFVERRNGDVEMKVEDGSLRIRSNRTAVGYLDRFIKPLADPNGFIDTGDLVERHGERFQFVGRRDGVINVGGNKVHPEMVEGVINQHPQVAASLVKARRSPISGALVIADVVAKIKANASGGEAAIETLRREIIAECRAKLSPHQVPVMIRFVSALEIGTSGKLLRPHA